MTAWNVFILISCFQEMPHLSIDSFVTVVSHVGARKMGLKWTKVWKQNVCLTGYGLENQTFCMNLCCQMSLKLRHKTNEYNLSFI